MKTIVKRIAIIMICVLCIGLMIQLHCMHDAYRELSGMYNELYFKNFNTEEENEEFFNTIAEKNDMISKLENELRDVKTDNTIAVSKIDSYEKDYTYLLTIIDKMAEHVDEDTIREITYESFNEVWG